jgi:hypothetical protein
MNKKLVTYTLAAAIAVPTLPGCMGQMGLTQAAMGLNLKAVDNRWGRAGLYLLMSPIYAVTSVVDLLVINAIEFFTGTNPLTKKSPAVVDEPADTWLKVDDSLDDSVTEAPISSNGFEIQAKDDNGVMRTFGAIRNGDHIDLFLDGEHIATTTAAELLDYQETNQAKLDAQAAVYAKTTRVKPGTYVQDQQSHLAVVAK